MARLKLRDFQQEALKAVQDTFKKGVSNQLIVLPTGTDKTILMAAIARKYDKRVLLLAHREELMKQAVDKIKLYAPNADIGICKAKQNELSKQIVVGSVQSCFRSKRLAQLKKENFKILMIDEAHHSESPSYQKIITELGFLVGELTGPWKEIKDSFLRLKPLQRKIQSSISFGGKPSKQIPYFVVGYRGWKDLATLESKRKELGANGILILESALYCGKTTQEEIVKGAKEESLLLFLMALQQLTGQMMGGVPDYRAYLSRNG